jgi:hypothetical protein
MTQHRKKPVRATGTLPTLVRISLFMKFKDYLPESGPFMVFILIWLPVQIIVLVLLILVLFPKVRMLLRGL